uniref:MAGE domain-containing protein n=1 Tax=Jaculus jaculus TaxID=51337 RepID=A0A8C5P175_JACJA
MSQHQENPQGTHDVSLQTFKEPQSVEVEQASRDVEETFPSSHPVISSSSCSYSEDTSSSSSTSSEYSSSQEDEDNTTHSPDASDSETIPVDSLKKKVNFLVNYMLHKYQMKDMMRKEDILKIVITEDEEHFHDIFRQATERMEMLFGLEVKEVDSINHCYGFFIKLGLTYDGMQNDEYSFPKTGLLILILGVIYMKGNRATEEEMWEALNLMGIYSEMNDFIFGDPRELITKEFVAEQYLECRQVPNTDPVQYEYVWGPRACAETSKMKVLELVAKLHGTVPSAFPSQYEEALLEERENTTESTSDIISRFPYT